MYDVVIVGAGAAGVMGALIIKQKKPDFKVLLLERNDKLGKKLLITGNGRCNLGNTDNNIENYGGENVKRFQKYFANLDGTNVLDFLKLKRNPKNYYEYLNYFGVLIKEEEGRLYPYSSQALTVCKAFERSLKTLNVEVRYNYEVKRVVKKLDNFVINSDVSAKRVVIATGGKSYPKTGSTGIGYEILKDFGHKITNLYPSLVPLKTNYKYLKDLAGVRSLGVVSLNVDGKDEEKETGQVQFTKDSLSGICVFNLSKNVGRYLAEGRRLKLVINFIPDYNTDEIENYLRNFSNYRVEEALCCILNNKLAHVISKDLKLDGEMICNLTKQDFKKITLMLRSMCFDVVGTGMYDASQVTSGGALTDEFTNGLESTKCKGLYAIGEVLDVTGKCGGYNLAWAFTSALIAAKDITRN